MIRTTLMALSCGAGAAMIIIILVELRRRSARRNQDPICPHCGGHCVLVPLMANEDPALDTVMCDKCLWTMQRWATVG